MSDLPHIARRRIEAELIGRLYNEMCAAIDQPTALKILTSSIESAAFAEGRRFAAQADGPPSLAHFRTVLAAWGGALQMELLEETDDLLRFNVVRCDYISTYEDLALPPELVSLLSCRRDAPFARGYSDHLEFTREGTLAEGRACCDFCYRWRE